jgi:hypothetical protein
MTGGNRHSPSPGLNEHPTSSNSLSRFLARPRNPTCKSVYVTEYWDKIMSAFTQARILEKGKIQPLVTWNRIVNECWDMEPDNVKAKINVVCNERIDQLRQELGTSTAKDQILYVCKPFLMQLIRYTKP